MPELSWYSTATWLMVLFSMRMSLLVILGSLG
jgi:hypothetical protein